MLHRTTLISLVVCGLALLVALPANAQEDNPATAAAPAASPDKQGATSVGETTADDGDKAEGHGCKRGCQGCAKWSLGAGIGYFSGSTSGLWGNLGNLGYGALSTTAPSYGLSAERRLGHGLWLSFAGSVLHNRGDVPVSSLTGSQTTVQRYTTSGNLSAGLRWLLLEDVVDVSVYGKLGATYARLSGDARDSSSNLILGAAPRSYAYAIGATAGLALDRQLIDRLSLRFSADIFDTYWTAARVRTIINATDMVVTKPRGMSVGLALRPVVELRLAF
jgi:hypothetical protein